MPHKKAKRSIRDVATAARGYDNPPTNSQSYSGPVASTLSAKAKGKKRGSNGANDLDEFGGRRDLGGVSKSVYRVLNSVAIRAEYNANRKRKREDDEKVSSKKSINKKPLEPLPYESLSAFSRRVETALRPDIDSAIKASKAANKKNTAKKPKPVDPSLEADSELAASASSSSKKKGKDTIDPLATTRESFRKGPTEFARADQRKNLLDVAMAPPTLKKQRQMTVGATTDPLPSHRMPISESIKRAMDMEREKAIGAYRLLKEKREKEQKEEQAKQ